MFLLAALCLSRFALAQASGEPIAFPQRLDHDDPTDRKNMWAQYIIIDYTFSGQGNLRNTIVYLTSWHPMAKTDPFPSSVKEIARRTKSAMIAIEHRYFGNSMPTNMTVEEMAKYLTIEQTLGDIAQVIDSFKSSIKKLVIIGGGYGGILAAWFKTKYPQYAHGVWASSAPVLLIPFNSDADSVVLDKMSETCREATVYLMQKLNAIFTSGDEASKTKMKQLFRVHDSISDTVLLYEVAESLLLMAQSEASNARLLSSYCYNQKSANMDLLAEYFSRALTAHKLTSETLDPFMVGDTPELKSSHARWFLQCSSFGQFNVYNEVAQLRSRLINETFYNDVCQRLFGFPVSTGGDFEASYGGLTQGGSSTIFTYSARDYRRSLMQIVPDESDEIYARVIDGESYATDLDVESEQDSTSLKNTRAWAISTVANWVSSEAEQKCSEHGDRILNQCKCHNGWIGPDCSTSAVTYSSFKMTGAVTALVPTIVILVCSTIAWQTIINNEEAIGPKKIVF